MIHEHLALLAEPVRVRLLRLLAREELGVGELVRVVQLPQSTVSRHLKALSTAGWIQDRNEGPSHLFRLSERELPGEAAGLWAVVRDAEAASEEDLHRLAAVVAARQVEGFFGRHAEGWDAMRRELFGSDTLLPTLLALLPPEWTVADLGCGTGGASELLAPVVRRVIAVDREQAMLDAAERRLAVHRNVELRRGELGQLPIATGEADAAVCLLVLHHVPDLAAALAEMRRVLAPGGRAVLLDMVEHDRSAYRQTMGHVHLGFSEAALRGAADAAGLCVERWQRLPPAPEAQGPGLFLAVLRRP